MCVQVTCGGLQSAHTAAVAALCAECGVRAHLLVRGERPAVPTGLHLYARMLGDVTYIDRGEYADREAMLAAHVRRIEAAAPSGSHVRNWLSICWRSSYCFRVWATRAGTAQVLWWARGKSRIMDAVRGRHDCAVPSVDAPGTSSVQVMVIREGAADATALLGLVRLADFLTRPEQLGTEQPCHLFVDSGTGVTATGEVYAVMQSVVDGDVRAWQTAQSAAQSVSGHVSTLQAWRWRHCCWMLPGPSRASCWRARRHTIGSKPQSS